MTVTVCHVIQTGASMRKSCDDRAEMVEGIIEIEPEKFGHADFEIPAASVEYRRCNSRVLIKG